MQSSNQSLKPINYLLVAAIDKEVAGLAHYAPIVLTGIGKVNATIQLYAGIEKYKPDVVINYGSAGAIGTLSGLHKVDTFVQHDMDVRPLGVPRGVTPFSDPLPTAKGIVLGSGDVFVTNTTTQLEGMDIELDLIDMEAYALNEVCKHHNIEFHSYKFVTDTTDENSHGDWSTNVSKGTTLFSELLNAHYGKSALL